MRPSACLSRRVKRVADSGISWLSMILVDSAHLRVEFLVRKIRDTEVSEHVSAPTLLQLGI